MIIYETIFVKPAYRRGRSTKNRLGGESSLFALTEFAPALAGAPPFISPI